MSSFLFMLPAVYAFTIAMYSWTILLTITTLISANYWRNATYSWRRLADHVWAKISFTTFLVNGVMHLEYFPFIITSYPLLIILLYCYYKSCTLNSLGKTNWWRFHLIFHIIMTYQQFIVLYSIHSYNISRNENI